MLFRRIYIIALLTIAAPTFAAEEETSPWSGKAHLGYLATSGNTDNTSLNTGFEIGYTAGKWQHLLDAQAINSSQDNITTAEAYDVGWKSERNLTERDFLFGQLDWRKDLFSGYDTQFSQAVGYGRRLINTEVHKLNAEIGVGARQADLVDGSSEDETILTGGLNYIWQFSETANFTQDFAVESGSDNTYFESVTAVSAKLVGELALVASYTVKNNSDVPALTEKTDTFAALSLEYVF
jgi:putative salt-induced outer membrane protein